MEGWEENRARGLEIEREPKGTKCNLDKAVSLLTSSFPSSICIYIYALYYIKYVLNGIVLFHESFKSSKAAFLGNQSSAGFAAMLPHLSFASGKLPPHAEPCLVGKTCTVGNTVGYVEFRAGADDYLALNN